MVKPIKCFHQTIYVLRLLRINLIFIVIGYTIELADLRQMLLLMTVVIGADMARTIQFGLFLSLLLLDLEIRSNIINTWTDNSRYTSYFTLIWLMSW